MKVYLDRLIDCLDVVTTEELRAGIYIRLSDPDIGSLTQKAALINGNWVPKSQMKCDFERDIYLASWLYNKLFRYNDEDECSF